MSEHRLGGVFPMADKVLVMDEGEMIRYGNPREVAMGLKGTDFFKGLPEAVKLYADFEKDWKACPLTVGAARRWLSNYPNKEKVYEKFGGLTNCQAADKKIPEKKKGQPAIRCKDIWFRYERNADDVVKGLSINVDKRNFGYRWWKWCRKSTMLSLMWFWQSLIVERLIHMVRCAMLIIDAILPVYEGHSQGRNGSRFKSLKD